MAFDKQKPKHMAPTYEDLIKASYDQLLEWKDSIDKETADLAKAHLDSRDDAIAKDGGIDRPKYPPLVP